VTFPKAWSGEPSAPPWRPANSLDTGSILTIRCGGGVGGVDCIANNDVNTHYVQTRDSSNTVEASRAFHIVVH
jgi:hypothetical protein